MFRIAFGSMRAKLRLVYAMKELWFERRGERRRFWVALFENY